MQLNCKRYGNCALGRLVIQGHRSVEFLPQKTPVGHPLPVSGTTVISRRNDLRKAKPDQKGEKTQNFPVIFIHKHNLFNFGKRTFPSFITISAIHMGFRLMRISKRIETDCRRTFRKKSPNRHTQCETDRTKRPNRRIRSSSFDPAHVRALHPAMPSQILDRHIPLPTHPPDPRSDILYGSLGLGIQIGYGIRDRHISSHSTPTIHTDPFTGPVQRQSGGNPKPKTASL